jgi:hypothetical protein
VGLEVTEDGKHKPMKLVVSRFPIFTPPGSGSSSSLANPPMFIADLFLIGPTQNGQYIYATNATGDIVLPGGLLGFPAPIAGTYHALQFGQWSRGSIKVKVGLESNGTQLTVITGQNVPANFPGTSALMNDGIKYGLLGNAPVTIMTAYCVKPFVPNSNILTMPFTPTATAGVLTQFQGMVTDIEQLGLTKAVITVQDMLYLLNMKIPNRILQASCSWVLYSPGCTLNAASYTVSGTVGTITYPYQFSPISNMTPVHASSSPNPSVSTFTQGTLKWTSGLNTGLAYFVRQWIPGGSSSDQIILDVQPIFPIASGDNFTMTSGCDKSFTSCQNLQGLPTAYNNFGGQPDTPVPETAI